MYRPFLILFILSTYFCFVYGQEKEELYVKQIDTRNGLPSSVIYYLFEDSKGFIWVATDNGVAKYNGYDFEYFNRENGLTNNDVFFITEDPKTGYIWFNAFKGGLCYYDGKKILEHPLNHSIKQICKRSWVSTFYIDSLDNLWFTSTNRELGLDTMDYTFYKIPPTNDTILRIKPTDKNSIRVAQNTYIKTFESTKPFALLKAGSVVSFPFDTTITVPISPPLNASFLQSGFGQVFQLTNGKILGHNAVELLVFDRKKVHHIRHYWKEGIIYQVCEVGKKIFVCTSKGAILLDQNYEIEQRFLEKHAISQVLLDKDGNYWFSTINDGVFVTSSLGLKQYLMQEVVERIEMGLDSNFYFNTKSKNVYKCIYNSKLNSFDMIKIRSKEQQTNSIEFFFSENRKAKLKSSYKNKEQIKKNDLMLFFLEDPDYIKAFRWRRDGAAMVGFSNGFSIYNDLEVPNIFNSVDIGFIEWVKVIKQGIDDDYWIGTGKGLYSFSSLDSEPIFFGEKDHRLQGSIKDIATLSTGEILVATSGNGLIILDGEKRYSLSKKEGLSSNIIRTIFVENNHSVWLGTNRGINHLIGDLEKPKVAYYNTENGFPINDIRIIKKAKGHLLVGGNKGLIVFKQNSKPSNKSYQTYLHHVEVNNQSRPAKVEYTFENYENNLVFHFRTIRFNKLQEYYYRLIGIDTIWQKGAANIVRYNKLPYGQYTFEVKAKNSPVLQVPFRIKPHFTQTWIFIGAISILLLGIVIWTIFFFLKKQKEKLLQEQRMSDLENKALRSQMNPHFIFNAMNSIMFLIMNNNNKAARHYLYHFSKLMRLVLENSKHNFVPLQDEVKSLKSYLELEELRYGSQIQIHWELLDEYSSFSYKIPPMLIQPVVENALIHGLGSRKEAGNLWISFVNEKEGLYIIIRDDGVGRIAAVNLLHTPNLDNQKSTGLQNIESRIQNINTIYQTALDFNIEDLYEEGQASGTKVTFFIPQE
jgi:ligand-binding sensor domain-containing protein